MLTLGHFLFGRPIESLPDPSFSYRPILLLCQWHLCQNIVHQFCQRWRQEYLTSLWRYAKWHEPTRNLSVGDNGFLGCMHGNVQIPLCTKKQACTAAYILTCSTHHSLDRPMFAHLLGKSIKQHLSLIQYHYHSCGFSHIPVASSCISEA